MPSLVTKTTLIPDSRLEAWIALVNFFFDGADIEVYWVIGPLTLTKQEAEDTLIVSKYLGFCYTRFLETVYLPVKH